MAVTQPFLVEVPYGSISYVVNKPQKMKIDCGNLLRNIQLYLDIQADSSAGWTALQEDNPLQLIQNIELYGLLKSKQRGKVSFFDCGADLLYYFDYFMNRSAAHRVQKPSAASESNVKAYARLNLSFLPKFVLDTNLFTELWLNVRWGNPDNLGSPAGSVTIDSAEIKVQSEEYTRKTPEVIKQMGWMREVSEKAKNVAASGKDTIELPKSMLYNQIMVEIINNSIRSDTLVTNVAMKYGRTAAVFESDYPSLKVKNKSDYQVDTLENGYVTVEGIVIIPLKQLINPVNYSTWDLEFTAGAPTPTATVRTLIERVAPLGQVKR